MNRQASLRHEFVDFMPSNTEEGALYISMVYATAIHRCCCGCGNEVVTPLSPTDWTLTFDGASVSLDPSIGNWSFPCRSHYWIENGRVHWASSWSEKQIREGRNLDRRRKARHFAAAGLTSNGAVEAVPPVVKQPTPRRGFWERLSRLWR